MAFPACSYFNLLVLRPKPKPDSKTCIQNASLPKSSSLSTCPIRILSMCTCKDTHLNTHTGEIQVSALQPPGMKLSQLLSNCKDLLTVAGLAVGPLAAIGQAPSLPPPRPQTPPAPAPSQAAPPNRVASEAAPRRAPPPQPLPPPPAPAPWLALRAEGCARSTIVPIQAVTCCYPSFSMQPSCEILRDESPHQLRHSWLQGLAFGPWRLLTLKTLVAGREWRH